MILCIYVVLWQAKYTSKICLQKSHHFLQRDKNAAPLAVSVGGENNIIPEMRIC